MTMAADGSIYFINNNGINQLDLESGEVRVMMEPVGTCLGDANYYISGFAALPDNIFVLLAKSMWGEEGNFVAIYHEMDIQNRMPFIITSVNYNFLLETAASEFQKLHPELKVEVNNLVKKATLEQLDVDDLIRITNTELLAGKGGEVLLLDELPTDAIFSRGLLLDISHIAKEVRFLQGIAKSLHRVDGKIYAIPAEFSIFQLAGTKSAIESIKTFPDILNAPLEPGQMRLPMNTQLSHLFAACKQDFIDDKGVVLFQSEPFIEFLHFLYSVFDEIEREAFGISEENRIIIDNTSLKNGAIAFYPAEAKWLLSVEDYYDQYGGEDSAVILMPSLYSTGNAYRPRTILGIPRSAENPSLSEEFIRLMLSDEMQLRNPLYSGFSTVEKKLDALFEQRIEGSYRYPEMFKQEEDGVRIVKSPSEEYFHILREKLNSIAVPIYDDSTMLMFIEEGMVAFLDGNITAEETAKDIEQRAWLYINE